MKTFAAGVVAGLMAFCSGPAYAQTVQPDFSGTWSLDRSLSTDVSQMSMPPSAPPSMASGGRARGGFGIGGRGGSRGGGSRNSGDALTPAEQAKAKVLSDQLKAASSTLIITHQDSSFIVNDSRANALFFETTGVSEDNQLGGETLTSSTHWDDSRLVTEFTLGTDLTVVYTYTLLPKTNQLVLRITRKAGTASRATSPEIKLVYKLTR
jgi:hypothetical protein